MSQTMKQKIEARIAELEAQKERALTSYNDKDAEISQATQEMSDHIRTLRKERGRLALEASACQQKIDELKNLLAAEGGGGS